MFEKAIKIIMAEPPEPHYPSYYADLLREKSSEIPNSSDLNKFIDGLEEIFADIRERHGDDSVCGLCEYDGAYIGQSGDWCNECPGFDRDDCFKLSDECRKRWINTITNSLPSAQPEHSEGLYVDGYNDGYREGMKDAQQEQRWIPVSERPPEDLQEVNVTWVNHSPEPYYNFTKGKPFTASAVYYKGNWYWYSSTCADILGEYGRNDVDKVDDAIEITAWMPLPEPYGGEQDGRDSRDSKAV